jgi:hypothetical protein
MFISRKFLFYYLLVIFLFLTGNVIAQEVISTATPLSTQRVWSVKDLLTEVTSKGPVRRKIRYCQGGRFAPCVCHQDVSRDMRYRPALKECNGNSAVILSGKYLNVFSAVVRDSENRDRWPSSGFNGCSPALAQSESPPALCSAFKAQDIFDIGKGRKRSRVYCFGSSGYSELFKRVVRVTVKLSDKTNSNDDPLVRWCLKDPEEPLN